MTTLARFPSISGTAALLLGIATTFGCPASEPDAGSDGGFAQGPENAEPEDGGQSDGGPDDGGALATPDGGPFDSGPTDAGTTDAGAADAGLENDSGTDVDAGRVDGGSSSTGANDAGVSPDAGTFDGGPLVDGGGQDGGPSLCDDETCALLIVPRRATFGLGSAVLVDMDFAAVFRPPTGLPEVLRAGPQWRSLDTSVATVDNDGVVHPVAAGETFIEASYNGELAYSRVRVAGTVSRRTLIVGGEERSYILYTPPSPQGPLTPLLLSFHGGGGSGPIQMKTSQFTRPAEREGVLVAYPTGSGIVNTWNAGSCCGPAEQSQSDDVAFARAIVSDMQADFSIDPNRIYSTGFSNGSMLTHRLACEASDLFAAVATIGGGRVLGGDFASCSPGRPVPILMIHGTTDRVYPYLGGPSLTVDETFHPIEHPTAPDTLTDWQTTNGATSGPLVVFDSGQVQCREWSGAAPVQLCRVDTDTPLADADIVYDGAGHAIPGGGIASRESADVPNQDLRAAEHAWSFLERHTLDGL